MKKEIMKDAVALSIIFTLVLLFVFEIAWGQTPGLREPDCLAGVNGPCPGEADDGMPCHVPAGPPPEAYRACEGAKPGSISGFTALWGETIIGVCRRDESGRLLLIPDPPEDWELAGNTLPPACCEEEPEPIPGEWGGMCPVPPPWREQGFGRMGFMD
ncbi:MAG TPA: hypothetical protein PLO63_04335 [Syntrophales bacterium]|nr:hypothetical protein [Syntrophales bacterium]